MKPKNLATKIFLDSGDPNETREIIKALGFLDGQTTNPTLISKNPEAASRLQKGKKFTKEEIYSFYKEVVGEISFLIPDGSVSVEVYADKNTSAEEMFLQGKEMFSWIPNAHIKYPTTAEGLKAAERSVKEGMRVNMTLCFSQEQASAVYAATLRLRSGQAHSSEQNNLPNFRNVFVSPFVGRLDDLGENGMSLIENISKMYMQGDGHVEVLVASVRSNDHFLRSLQMSADIVTSPFKILKEWADKGMQIPDVNYKHSSKDSKNIPYQELDLSKKWQDFSITHELTDKGIDRFSQDWNALIYS
jgi:transaldolase